MRHVLILLFSVALAAQTTVITKTTVIPKTTLIAAPAVTAPTFVNSGSNFAGTGSLATGAWHPLTGNHLVVVSSSNDTSTTRTCSDNASGGSNTYVRDGTTTSTALSIAHFHVVSISNSGAGALTITCTGTTPTVAALEYSGGTGALDTASAGGTGGNAIIGASNASVSTLCAPGAFTPTTAATILVDGFGSTDGGTVTALTQTDASYTTQGSCLTGASCFMGAFGSRVVASSASYTDGMSWTTSAGPLVCQNAAYK